VPDLPRSFVALGDSFTEGMQDELGPEGRHLGWADRVAAALAVATGGLRYANLAVRGRLLDQVVDEQLPVALELAPDLVSFHAGPNDALRPRTDIADILRRYDAAVARLRAGASPSSGSPSSGSPSSGSAVLLFTVLERAGGTGRTADRLAARFGRFNDGVRATARRHGALLVDVGPVAALHDRRLWHEDRLHLSPEGHARVAAAVLETLGVADAALLGGGPGWWQEPLPPGPPPRRRADLVADVRWVRRHFLPWVGRRVRGVSSGDGMSPKHTALVDVLPR
jgi:lysophospholipase L1-like esterase